MAILIEPPKTIEGNNKRGKTLAALFLGELIPFAVYENSHGSLEISVLATVDKYWQPAFTSKLKSNLAYRNAQVLYPSVRTI